MKMPAWTCYRWADIIQMIENDKAVQNTSTVSMKGRRCVISGATSGVGLAAARRLAQAGADLLLVCRDRSRADALCRELKDKNRINVEYRLADFTSIESVRRTALEIASESARVDVLINSVGLHSTTRKLTQDGNESVFSVNHLGPFLLTCLLLDKLRESAPSRIIQVNSQGHRFAGLRLDDLDWSKRPYGGLRGYGASKTAQLFTVMEMADRLAGSGITVNAMHPGSVRSNIGQNNGPLYRWYIKNFIWKTLKDPAISGEALYYLVSSPDLAGVNGRFFNLTMEEKPAPHVFDSVTQRGVWEESCRLCGLDTGIIPPRGA